LRAQGRPARRGGAEERRDLRAHRPRAGRQRAARPGVRSLGALEPARQGGRVRHRPRGRRARAAAAPAGAEGPRVAGLRVRGSRRVVRAAHAQGARRGPAALLPPDRLPGDRREAARARSADRGGDDHARGAGRDDRAHGRPGQRSGERARLRAPQGARQVLPRGPGGTPARLQGARARKSRRDGGRGPRADRVGGRAWTLEHGRRLAQRHRGELAGAGGQHGLQAPQEPPSRLNDMDGRIYLDHNAGAPLRPEAHAAMLAVLGGPPANPSSAHREGARARRLLEEARAGVASLIGAWPGELTLTSGATEANNLALRGAVAAAGSRDGLVVSAIEHASVLETAQALAAAGARATVVPVDTSGRVDPDRVAAACDERTAVVSLGLAHGEIGTLAPIARIADALRGRGIVLHTDAAQAAGRVSVDVAALGVELVSLSSHEVGGTPGAGA